MILFGGTFDPVHLGHLRIARYASELLDRPAHLLLAPQPQLRPPVTTSYTDRWAMLQLACEHEPALIPLDAEQSTPGPTHTIATLERLQKSTQEEFVWVLGSDALQKFHLWFRAEELCVWLSLLVLIRPGFENVQPPTNFQLVDDASELLQSTGQIFFSTKPRISLSATMIRKHRNQGKDIGHCVSAGVYEYIISKHLYEPKDSC